ncbi:hypothetical protein FRC10_002868, partial [Ceratobasidium sp. 414]
MQNHNVQRRSLDGLPDEMVGYTTILCATHIELEVNGLQIARDVPGDDSDLTLLRKLQRYRDAWLDLDIRPPVWRYCGSGTMRLWELRGGVFAKAVATSGAKFSPHLKQNSLLLFPLGASNDTRVDFGREFDEFTLDPSQDLAVLVGVGPEMGNHGWACFHSSITGQVHPQATHPVVTVELGFVVPLTSIFDLVLDIKGDLVAVKYSSPEDRFYEILIWNWKT